MIDAAAASDLTAFAARSVGILALSAVFVWLIFRRVKGMEGMRGDAAGLRRSLIRSGIVLSLPLILVIIDEVRGAQPAALLIVVAIPTAILWIAVGVALRAIKRQRAFGPDQRQ